jgi:hypothetical protein
MGGMLIRWLELDDLQLGQRCWNDSNMDEAYGDHILVMV